jgi:hypothetical protein
MDNNGIDRLARRLEVAQTRRASLGNGFAALSALGFALGRTDVEAKKKHKEHHKKRKSVPPTCAELCGFACEFCFVRADAPTLCGTANGTVCVPCSSDNDCVGGDPYCVAQVVNRENNSDVSSFCDPDGGCDCPAGAKGVCTAIGACGA